MIRRNIYKDNINEGFLLNFFRKIKGFFIKKIGGFLIPEINSRAINASMPVNTAIAQERGLLSDHIIIIPSAADVELAKSKGIHLDLQGALDSLKMRYTVAENENLLSPFRKYRRLNEEKIKFEHNDKNIENVNAKELKRFIKISIKRPETSVPLLIWGAPGIGKTQIVSQVLKEVTDMKGRLIDLNIPRLAPDEFFLPYMDSTESGKKIAGDAIKKWLPVYEITGDPEKDAIGDEIANSGYGGVLFFDEISRANKGVQNVCMKFIDERQMNGFRLGSKWAIIAATNRPDDDDSSQIDQGPAMKNRFMHVNFIPTVEDWSEWGRKNLEYPEIVDFIELNKEYFYTLDNDPNLSVFASPRTWANASRELAIAEEVAKEDGEELTRREMQSIIATNVGKQAAGYFMEFMQVLKHFPKQEIKKVWTNADSVNITFQVKSPTVEAVLSSVIEYMDGKTITGKEFMNFCKFCVKLDNYSYAALALQMLQAKHPYLTKQLARVGDNMGEFKEGSDIFSDHYNKSFD